jgi:CDP-diacylglycerol--glycerol-3-phosphate 3-phosphatidyltransferase
VNLPNALTAGRIAAAPFIAWLPLASSATLRFAAFVLFAAAAITDYIDGHLARSRAQETDLGRMLDPLADKLLLVATLVPMFLLMGSGSTFSIFSPHHAPLVAASVGAVARGDGGAAFPFVTPLGLIGLPWWIPAVIIGREAFMSVFRQIASRRGVVITSIGPAKWKTGFQLVWVGGAFLWFWLATLAVERGWAGGPWRDAANLIGTLSVMAMTGATALTLYSLALYVRSHGRVLAGAPHRPA